MDNLKLINTSHALLLSGVLLAVIVVQSARKQWSRRNSLPLPPGPPGHWLLGNTIPELYPHRKFEEWIQEYGPIITVRQGSQVLIVIGRQQAAIDIMEKEGVNLVDRPDSFAVGEGLSGGMRLLLMHSGERFKKLRMALHSQLQMKVASTYEPIQYEGAKVHALDILRKPTRHQDHAKKYAASVIMTISYGKTTPTSYSDPEVQGVNRCLTRMGEMMKPGSQLVDSYPLLRFVPGYMTQIRKWHQEELNLFKSQMDVVRRQMATNEAPPSFARYLIEREDEHGLNEDETAYLAGSMFGAGSDTTASAISIVILAAACYPEAQKKVQEELDAVVGKDRAPTFEDYDQLVQTTAFMLETFRWRAVGPGGFIHRATKDIIWNNYLIPAGASVVGNLWSIARDTELYPNPEHFDPNRWLNVDKETGDVGLKDGMRFFAYGFGRRVCPGQHVANRSIWINTAMMLWGFDIKPIPSKPIDVFAFTQSVNAHPLPFQVDFEARVDVEGILSE